MIVVDIASDIVLGVGRDNFLGLTYIGGVCCRGEACWTLSPVENDFRTVTKLVETSILLGIGLGLDCCLNIILSRYCNCTWHNE